MFHLDPRRESVRPCILDEMPLFAARCDAGLRDRRQWKVDCGCEGLLTPRGGAPASEALPSISMGAGT